MESLGEYLKREREYRSISLEEISLKTKIRKNILRGLEEDRLGSLSSPVFVKGYLKAYAGYVGLDPNEVVLRYEASLKPQEEPRVKKPAEETPRQWSLKYVVLPVSILLLLGILLYMTLQKPMRIETTVEPQEVREPATASLPQAESKDTPPSEEVETISQIPSPGKEAFLPVPPVHPSRQSAISPPEPPRGIELEITALEDTWIQIQIDLAPSREIFLRPGEVFSRRGQKNIEMKIGNAGGLRILHNGKDVGRLGESGKVVYLSLSPQEVKVRSSGGLLPNRP
jgi:cytoskeletal protein RodZ